MNSERKRDYLPLLVDHLGKDAPALSADQLRDLVLKAMPDTHFHGSILRYLEREPKALRKGLSDMRPALILLADLLIGLGVPNIRRPVCAICEKPKTLPYKHGNGRVCGACFKSTVHTETCSTCGRERGVSTRGYNGVPICQACRSASRKEICSSCGTNSPVAVRPASGPLCQLCYKAPPRTCAACKEIKSIHSTKDGVDLCRDCYPNGGIFRTSQKNRKRPMRRRACSSCRANRLCVDYLTDEPLCTACAGRPVRPCADCGDERPVQALLEAGPVCMQCYDKRRWLLPEMKERKAAYPISEPPNTCKECGRRIHLYADGTCLTCVVEAQVKDLLSNQDGRVPDALKPVFQALTRDRNPGSIVGWLRHSDGATILRRMALGYDELSHDTLNRQARSESAEYVRSILIASKVLPPIDGQMRLDVWLDAFMLDVPKRDAFYVRTFAQWRVFRGLRGKIEREKATDASMKWAQIRVRTAAQFLSWLAERETDITHCTQAIVDLWLTESDVVTPYIVRDFVRWATKRGFAKRLDVPRRTRKSAVEPMDEDQRWSDIDRLLAASNLSHDVRLIALLALIFAQQISRVCTLTIEHVREGPDGVFVRFGKDPIEMPPILAQVVAEQVKSARTNPKAKRLDGKRWLFPGQHYGEHVTPDALGRRLSAIGVRSRPARNAALMSFAAELNPGIIATAFNLHVNTATLWAVHAGATYNRHVARCIEDDALEDNPSSPPPAFKKPKRRAARA